MNQIAQHRKRGQKTSQLWMIARIVTFGAMESGEAPETL